MAHLTISSSAGATLDLHSPGPIGDVAPGPIGATEVKVGPATGNNNVTFTHDGNRAVTQNNRGPAGNAPFRFIASDGGMAIIEAGQLQIFASAESIPSVQVTSAVARLASNVGLAWSATTDASGGTYDLHLLRDAANALAQRNGTNAQTSRLYGTYTDDSNYERLSITVDATGIHFASEAAGTGTVRDLILPGGARFDNSGVVQVAYLTATGYATIYGQLSVLLSYGHGVTFVPLPADAGLLATDSATGGTGVIRFKFPSADPHVAGEWWDNGTTLVRSNG